MSNEMQILREIEEEMEKLAHAYEVLAGAIEKKAGTAYSEHLTPEERALAAGGRNNTWNRTSVGMGLGGIATGAGGAILGHKALGAEGAALGYILGSIPGAVAGGIGAYSGSVKKNNALDSIKRKNLEEYQQMLARSPRHSIPSSYFLGGAGGMASAAAYNKEIDDARSATREKQASSTSMMPHPHVLEGDYRTLSVDEPSMAYKLKGFVAKNKVPLMVAGAVLGTGVLANKLADNSGHYQTKAASLKAVLAALDSEK